MRMAFFVNSIDSETPAYTTTTLALAAIQRGHSVVYVEPSDFILRPDDSLAVSVAVLPDAPYKTSDQVYAAMKNAANQKKTFATSDIDILFLRKTHRSTSPIDHGLPTQALCSGGLQRNAA